MVIIFTVSLLQLAIRSTEQQCGLEEEALEENVNTSVKNQSGHKLQHNTLSSF